MVKDSAAQVSPQTQREIELLRDDLGLVRRDQLNYQLERDILKEAYSSNLQTINLVITIILGTFSVLGFLGVNRISALRKEFVDELQQLRDQRSAHEGTFRRMASEQESAKQELEKLVAASAKQDQRLKLLELREKAATRMRDRQYSTALDYIAIGLEIDAGDVRLLSMKCSCHGKLGQFEDAVVVCEQLVEIETHERGGRIHLRNLFEFCLLANRMERYAALRASFPNLFDDDRWIKWYLRALELYRAADMSGLKAHARELLAEHTGQAKLGGTWGFDEVTAFLRTEPLGDLSTLMRKSVSVLAGESSAEEFATLLGTLSG